MFKETTEKNSLSTLDFIINVLREHDKELTELSEHLKNTLTAVTGDNIKQTLCELNSSIQILAKTIEIVSEKIDSQSNASVRLGDTIDDLREESKRQRIQVHDILDQLKAFPIKDTRAIQQGY
ncbi:hypothetical protein MUP77_03490 [Candidatus Bathyarchaeota archaeon]|nr:hypothetical protein [Candidatus Bathyarchaeota archaeon]